MISESLGVIDAIEEHDSYRILIKHELLDRDYPNPLPIHIHLGIANSQPTNCVTLHYCTA